MPVAGKISFSTTSELYKADILKREAQTSTGIGEGIDIDSRVNSVVKRIEFGNVYVDINGKAEGYKLRLVDMVKKKLARGKTAEEIAQDLEESKETIQEIIDRI